MSAASSIGSRQCSPTPVHEHTAAITRGARRCRDARCSGGSTDLDDRQMPSTSAEADVEIERHVWPATNQRLRRSA